MKINILFKKLTIAFFLLLLLFPLVFLFAGCGSKKPDQERIYDEFVEVYQIITNDKTFTSTCYPIFKYDENSNVYSIYEEEKAYQETGLRFRNVAGYLSIENKTIRLTEKDKNKFFYPFDIENNTYKSGLLIGFGYNYVTAKFDKNGNLIINFNNETVLVNESSITIKYFN